MIVSKTIIFIYIHNFDLNLCQKDFGWYKILEIDEQR